MKTFRLMNRYKIALIRFGMSDAREYPIYHYITDCEMGDRAMAKYKAGKI